MRFGIRLIPANVVTSQAAEVDFSMNPYADGKFRFTDETLSDEINNYNRVSIRRLIQFAQGLAVPQVLSTWSLGVRGSPVVLVWSHITLVTFSQSSFALARSERSKRRLRILIGK